MAVLSVSETRFRTSSIDPFPCHTQSCSRFRTSSIDPFPCLIQPGVLRGLVILIPSRAARMNNIVSSSSLASDATAGFRVQGQVFGSEPGQENDGGGTSWQAGCQDALLMLPSKRSQRKWWWNLQLLMWFRASSVQSYVSSSHVSTALSRSSSAFGWCKNLRCDVFMVHSSAFGWYKNLTGLGFQRCAWVLSEAWGMA